MRSFPLILKSRSSYDLITKVATQVARSTEVHLASELFAKFLFHSDNIEQGGSAFRFEFDQYVDIAFWPEARRQDRAKQGEPADVVPLAELFDFVSRHCEDCAGHIA